MKEIKELNKWGDISCSWKGRINTVKMSVLPNVIYGFKTIFIKIIASYFMDIDKHSAVYMEGKRNQNSQLSIEKEEQSWKTDITSP